MKLSTALTCVLLANAAVAKPPSVSGKWRFGECKVEGPTLSYTYHQKSGVTGRGTSLNLRGTKPLAVFCSSESTKILTPSMLFFTSGALDLLNPSDPKVEIISVKIKPGFIKYLMGPKDILLLYPSGLLIRVYEEKVDGLRAFSATEFDLPLKPSGEVSLSSDGVSSGQVRIGKQTINLKY